MDQSRDHVDWNEMIDDEENGKANIDYRVSTVVVYHCWKPPPLFADEIRTHSSPRVVKKSAEASDRTPVTVGKILCQAVQ